MRQIDADALDMAIKALKQEPCEDCISRQAAIDVVKGIDSHFVKYIEALPSAQSEQKSCKTCHLWEDGEINIACPWGSNYEHYEDDYCSLWEKEN